MKKLVILLIIIICSCGLSDDEKPLRPTGNINLKDGMGKEVIVEYTYVGKNITLGQFKSMAEKVSSVCENQCKHSGTYVPRKLLVMYDEKGRKIAFICDHLAGNSYGVSGKVTTYVDVDTLGNVVGDPFTAE